MITRLTLDHALRVARNMRESDRREVMATRWLSDDGDESAAFAMSCMNAPGPKWVAINKLGAPVVMGGVAFNIPGSGTAWMVGTDDWLSVALEVSRFCKHSIKKLFDSGELHRIHAFSAVFHTESHRWLKMVGLQPNQLLHQWGKNREDFILFEVFKGN